MFKHTKITIKQEHINIKHIKHETKTHTHNKTRQNIKHIKHDKNEQNTINQEKLKI